MAALNIDVGNSSCVGGCEHCQMGRQTLPEHVHFLPETTRMVAVLLRYAQTCGDTARVTFTNPLLSLPDISFAMEGEVLAVSLRSFAELQTERRHILERLLRFTGTELEFHFNHHLLTYEQIMDFLPAIAYLFHGVCEVLPQVNEVSLSFSHNTVRAATAPLLQDSLIASHAFVEYLETFLGTRYGFGLAEVRQTRSGSVLKTRATVGFGSKRLSFRIRYVLAPDQSSVYVVCPFSLSCTELSLLIADQGVHVAHLTHAINQEELWFTHADFGDLLNQANAENESLLAVCRAAVEYRRSLKKV